MGTIGDSGGMGPWQSFPVCVTRLGGMWYVWYVSLHPCGAGESTEQHM